MSILLEGAVQAWSLNFLPSLWSLQTEGLTTDTLLVTVGGQGPSGVPLLAHSLVLAAASPTLARILATSSDTEEITLILPGVEREEMEGVLEDIYLGRDRARVFLQHWGLWEESHKIKAKEALSYNKEIYKPESTLEVIQKTEPEDYWDNDEFEDEVEENGKVCESMKASPGKRYKTCLEPGCSKQFAALQEFLKHSKDAHDISDAKDRLLIRNRLITPLPGGKLLCPDCPKEFTDKSKLADHLRRHDMKSSECEQCGKIIKIKNMKGHLATHSIPNEYKKETDRPESPLDTIHKTEPEDYWDNNDFDDEDVEMEDGGKDCESLSASPGKRYKTCLEPGCLKQFETRKQFIKHSQEDHNISDAEERILIRNRLVTLLPNGKLPCPDCSEEFLNQKKLAEHLRGHDAKSSTCELCGKSVAIKNMKGHLETHEKPGATIHCDLCDYSTQHKRMFKYHMTTHSGIKYTCDECGKSFNHRNTLTSHRASQHSGNMYKCDECDFTCKGHLHRLEMHKLLKHGSTSSSDLSEHKIEPNTNYTNTKARKPKREHNGTVYTCSEEGCQFSSNHKQSLKLHTDSKHLGITYKCELCDYTSGQLSNVKKHTIVKHKSHSCTICSFRCLDLEMMQTHMSQLH